MNMQEDKIIRLTPNQLASMLMQKPNDSEANQFSDFLMQFKNQPQPNQEERRNSVKPLGLD